jgi:hypothetical protein
VRNAIPLCRSDFLQDVTIALGRRSLKSLRMSNPTLVFTVSEDDVNGLAVERFDIEARAQLGRLTKMTLWEDGTCWVYSRERGKKNQKQPAPTLDLRATLSGMEADEIAKLLRLTLTDPQSTEKEWRSRSNKIG